MNDSITLPTGRSLGLYLLQLDPATQRFYYGSLDVTDYLSAEQKRSFAGYDVAAANNAASDQHRLDAGLAPVALGSTSTFDLFTQGVANDADRVARAARSVFGLGEPNVDGTDTDADRAQAKPFRTLLIVGGLLALGWLAWQVGVFAAIKKKLTA